MTATDGPDNYEFVLRAEPRTVEEPQALQDARAEPDRRHEARASRDGGDSGEPRSGGDE